MAFRSIGLGTEQRLTTCLDKRMHIHRSRDEKAIQAILSHPKVHPWLIDDLTPKDCKPVMHDSIIYLMDVDKTGVVRFDPMNGVCCQAHIATLPAMWGKAVEFSTMSIQWIFKNTKYQKIMTMVPEYNSLTVRLCRKLYMTQEGVLTKAFLKDWNLYSLIIFGINKHQEET